MRDSFLDQRVRENPDISARTTRFFRDNVPLSADIDELLFLDRLHASDKFRSRSLDHEYIVRLSGEAARKGVLTEQILDTIAPRIVDEVTASGRVDGQDLQIGLVGVEPGSLVLRFRTTDSNNGFAEPAPDQLPASVSRMDSVVSRIERLHQLIEKRVSFTTIRAEFGHGAGRELLWESRHLIEALDTQDLDFGIHWRNSVGRITSTFLTKQGREYARELFEEKEVESSESYKGRVRALDLNGYVTIAKNSKASRTAEIALEDLHRLTLGQQVTVTMRSIRKEDKVGSKRSGGAPRYMVASIDDIGEMPHLS